MKRTVKSLIAGILCFLSVGFFSCDEETINAILAPLTEADVVAGLKEALTIGSDSSVTTVSKVNGYFEDQVIKILLPDEVEQVLENAKSIPGYSELGIETLVNDLKADVVLSLNRAAEDAAPAAKDIFIDAITNMTISDGFEILNGEDTAATNYLRVNTYDQLTAAFAPSISASLDKDILPGGSANDIYGGFVSQYNGLVDNFIAQAAGFQPIENTDLGTYVTRKGLDGLFVKVAEKEEEIRNDPLAQVTDLLKKVFGS
jgi:hypothetical protein